MAAESERPTPLWAPAGRTEWPREEAAARASQVELAAVAVAAVAVAAVEVAAVEVAAVELGAEELAERRRAGRRLRTQLRRAISPRHQEPSGAAAWPAHTRAVESRVPDEGSHQRSSVRQSEAIRDNQRQSEAICTLACWASLSSLPSEVISEAIIGNQRPSVPWPVGPR